MDMFIWPVLVNCYTIVISTDTYGCNTVPYLDHNMYLTLLIVFQLFVFIFFNIE